jgi:hypothetical protein
LFRPSICSLRFAACLSCVGVRFISIVLILKGMFIMASKQKINCRVSG